MNLRSLGKLACAILALPAAVARAGDPGSAGAEVWELRARAVYLSPSQDLAGKTFVDLSGEWFILGPWSTEIALAFPETYRFRYSGAVNNGLRLAPNAWTLKYRFLPGRVVEPYVGAGLHYTTVSYESSPPDPVVTTDRSSVGWVAQAGLSFRIAEGCFLNADLRYLGSLEPASRISGTRAATFKVDPLLIGLGIGFRFGW